MVRYRISTKGCRPWRTFDEFFGLSVSFLSFLINESSLQLGYMCGAYVPLKNKMGCTTIFGHALCKPQLKCTPKPVGIFITVRMKGFILTTKIWPKIFNTNKGSCAKMKCPSCKTEGISLMLDLATSQRNGF